MDRLAPTNRSIDAFSHEDFIFEPEPAAEAAVMVEVVRDINTSKHWLALEALAYRHFRAYSGSPDDMCVEV